MKILIKFTEQDNWGVHDEIEYTFDDRTPLPKALEKALKKFYAQQSEDFLYRINEIVITY